MPAPSTSVRENALANVRSTLAAVTAGASYNFTIDKCARIDGPFFQYLDDNYKTLAFVEEGLTSWLPQTHDGLWLATIEVFVQVATKYEPDTPNPFEQTTDTKSTLRSKMEQDVTKALLTDPLRGQYAKFGTRVTDSAPINLDLIGEDGRWLTDKWTAYEIRFEVGVEVQLP